jgi:hypothetical protein
MTARKSSAASLGVSAYPTALLLISRCNMIDLITPHYAMHVDGSAARRMNQAAAMMTDSRTVRIPASLGDIHPYMWAILRC